MLFKICFCLSGSVKNIWRHAFGIIFDHTVNDNAQQVVNVNYIKDYTEF